MRRSALAALLVLAACRRTDPDPGRSDAIATTPSFAPASSTTGVPTAASVAPTVSASAPPADPGPIDDACTTHDDCVALELFVEGELRCCLSCGATAASSKAWADRFGAFCASARAMSDCPIHEECAAKPLDARCVGGHCQLAPRP